MRSQKEKHTQREGLYCPVSGIGSRSKRCSQTGHNSGAVTRISGDPSWNRNLKYMEWAAVDTLVDLTKGNVDTAHTC